MKKSKTLLGVLALVVMAVFITSCKKEMDNSSNQMFSDVIEDRGYEIKVIEYTGIPHEYYDPILDRHITYCLPPYGVIHCMTIVTCEEIKTAYPIKGKLTIHEGGMIESGLPIEEELDVTIYKIDDKNQSIVFSVNQ